MTFLNILMHRGEFTSYSAQRQNNRQIKITAKHFVILYEINNIVTFV